uniref:Uncharacterized protein n=1 Tax=Anguilla anguilla TaxID=7936 RepID=A0A0E9QBQ5_ANGAN
MSASSVMYFHKCDFSGHYMGMLR